MPGTVIRGTGRRLGRGCLIAGVVGAAQLAVTSSAYATRVLFDFGAAAQQTTNPADDPVNQWNNVTDTIGMSNTGLLGTIVDTAGNTLPGHQLAMIARFNGANTDGINAGPQSTLYPFDSTDDSLYGNTELWQGLSNVFPKFKLTGLDPAIGYDLTFYAARSGATDNRTTVYTIAGASTATTTLNPSSNVNGTTSVAGVLPSAAGEITIDLSPHASNNNGNHFTYIGVLDMNFTPVPEPATATLAAAGIGALATRRRGRR